MELGVIAAESVSGRVEYNRRRSGDNNMLKKREVRR